MSAKDRERLFHYAQGVGGTAPAENPEAFEVVGEGEARIVEGPGGVSVELNLSPAAEGPAWEWPAVHTADCSQSADECRCLPVNAAPCPHTDAAGKPVTCSEAEELRMTKANKLGLSLAEYDDIETRTCLYCQKLLVPDMAGSTDVWYADEPEPGTASGNCTGERVGWIRDGSPHEPGWSTAQMQRDFEVIGFGGYLCVVRRRSDGQRGSLDFTTTYDHPRVYFGFQEA
ncbi:MAG TPA: hypothetical protein VGI66_18050 [Streptosporangiaceae bacterium]|jgi:hypothetical protein